MGVYNPAETYQRDDIVVSDGSTFILAVEGPVTGVEPDPDAGPWEEIALRGATGSQGPQGIPGEPGPQNLFIQADQPVSDGPYLWVELLPGGDATIWIEDGT
jgi:hypothetical protein